MSPGGQVPSSRGNEMSRAGPPQSMQVISGSGTTMATVCPPSLVVVRVVAGVLRGRRILAPQGRATRPTTDKVREAVFNALGSLGLVEGAAVADLYAGCGALGIEALSRGAASCVFVERDRDALVALRQNLRELGLEDRSRVIPGDVDAVVGTLSGLELVLADPPYEFVDWAELLGRLSAPFVVAESGGAVEAPDGWEPVRVRRYGRTWVTFLQRVP